MTYQNTSCGKELGLTVGVRGAVGLYPLGLQVLDLPSPKQKKELGVSDRDTNYLLDGGYYTSEARVFWSDIPQ